MIPPHIVIAAPTQIGAELIDVTNPTLLSDATPTPAVGAIVEAQDRRTVNLRSALPVTAQRDSSRGWGRGKGGAARAEKEARAVASQARGLELESDRKPVILCHKPWAEVTIERGWWPRDDVGWWGRHDRAHNRWVGRDMVTVGVPTVSPHPAEDMYRADLALVLAAGSDTTEWPEWTPERRTAGHRKVSSEPDIHAHGARLYGPWATGTGFALMAGSLWMAAAGRCRPVTLEPPDSDPHGGRPRAGRTVARPWTGPGRAMGQMRVGEVRNPSGVAWTQARLGVIRAVGGGSGD